LKVDEPKRRIRAAVASAVADLAGPLGVACSGGADSVALADAAVAAVGGDRVVLLHVDHRLHDDSGATADAVRALAARLGAGCEVLVVTVPAGASLEDQARAARYAALEAAAARRALACILGGHTARDQAETVLLRVLRGTGPAGLAGIPPARGLHRRPLLAIARADTEAYCAGLDLPVVDDPMNADPRFARVRLRRDIVPRLAAENPRLEEALCRLARAAAEWTDAIDGLAGELAAHDPIPIAALVAAGPAIAKRALQLRVDALEAEHLDALWALMTAPVAGTRGLDLPGARIERVYDDLVIRTASAPAPDLVVTGPDAPYEIRTWSPGDRMCPARLRGRSRKLSDLFIDARVPRHERARARVVIRISDGQIVWAEHLGAASGIEIDVRPAISDRRVPPG
jgi:tRNA(Ile)-lysidine synthase